jgi:PAS domain S-box-containing protein
MLQEQAALIAQLQDEVERYRQEETEWARNKLFFRIIAGNVTDLIAIIDRHGHRLWNNPAYFSILGFSPEELEGTFSLGDVHPEDQARVMEAFNTLVETGNGQRIEYRMQHKNGSWVYLESQSTAVLDDQGAFECMVLIARDITRRRAIEAELIKAKKMESVSVLADGVAKEVAEVITKILGYSTVIKSVVGPNHPANPRIFDMERAAQHGREVVERLVAISQREDAPRKTVNMVNLLRDVANDVCRGSRVRPEFMMSDQLPTAEVEPLSMRHAFSSILHNALQSMHEGVVRITADVCGVTPDNRLPLEPGNYLRIRIRDQGVGMSPETAQRAFEPYFTTKPAGHGLGLTTALSVIQNHHGSILLDSNEGVGTTVSVYIKITHKDMRNGGNSHDSSSESKSGSQPLGLSDKQRILLMDDDPLILDVVGQMLEMLGYQVKKAKGGAQAIAMFTKAKSAGTPFDAVVMDLIIPNGVGGQDAVHTLRKLAPGIRCIASSGYTDHPAMLDYRAYGFVAAIPKPYKLEELRKALETALTGSSSGMA